MSDCGGVGNGGGAVSVGGVSVGAAVVGAVGGNVWPRLPILQTQHNDTNIETIAKISRHSTMSSFTKISNIPHKSE